MTSKEERRFCLIEVLMSDFLCIFKRSCQLKRDEMQAGDVLSLPSFDLPDDAYADSAQYQIERDSFLVRVISKEFEPVPLGFMIPVIRPKTMRFMVKVSKEKELNTKAYESA